ncbi:branched-chain amino acid ABC transporter permease [Pelagibius sp. Alg239-R121]|uniref:branched-chain amino acid ABC transporter permease n=1 Tax=Pelagibius sp. Alg239-R121 TaxID=2993448 RepID=UPI0024A6CA67|nr:branched-chain amino acid ABC transporter permease [Pelagibius sp. Alg239-R121]
MLREASLSAIIGLILMLVAPFVFDDIYTLTVLVIYGLLALSLGFIWGFGGILCFGQAAFFGLGAYAFAIASINFAEPWAAALIALIVPALFAAALGAMLFYGRLSDVYLAVVTLVATLILFKFMNSTAGSAYKIGNARLGGYNGIPGFDTLTLPWDRSEYLIDESLYYFCALILLAAFLGLRWLLTAPFGRILVGIRENELRAELVGYDVRLIKTLAFAIGGMLAGMAGMLFANWAEIVTPNLFSLSQSAEVIIWVIVGGAGSLLGPIVGAFALGALKFFLGQQTLVDNLFVLGSLLVLAVLFLPRGIVPTIALLFKGRRKGIRKKGARRTSRRRVRHAR